MLNCEQSIQHWANGNHDQWVENAMPQSKYRWNWLNETGERKNRAREWINTLLVDAGYMFIFVGKPIKANGKGRRKIQRWLNGRLNLPRDGWQFPKERG